MVVCVLCHVAEAVVYCYNDNASLCAACDDKIHKTNKLAWRHQRVYLCQMCEGQPQPNTASVYCSHDKVTPRPGIRVEVMGRRRGEPRHTRRSFSVHRVRACFGVVS